MKAAAHVRHMWQLLKVSFCRLISNRKTDGGLAFAIPVETPRRTSLVFLGGSYSYKIDYIGDF